MCVQYIKLEPIYYTKTCSRDGLFAQFVNKITWNYLLCTNILINFVNKQQTLIAGFQSVSDTSDIAASFPQWENRLRITKWFQPTFSQTNDLRPCIYTEESQDRENWSQI